MSLVFRIIHPRTPGIVGGDVDIGPAAVRLNGVDLTTAAAIGEAAASVIEFDDPSGILTPTGLWSFRVDENSLASNSAIYYGFLGDRRVGRDPARSLITGAERKWTAELVDLNAIAGFRMLTDDDAERPAETVAERLEWLIANSYAPFHDHGNVDYPTTQMSEANYVGRTFRDVLNDMALLTGYDWWLDVRQSDGQVSLFFLDSNTSTDYGTPLRISNVYADVTADASGWTRLPYIDAEMTRSAATVASGVFVSSPAGNVFVRSYATASNFNFRDLPAPLGDANTLAQATAIANRMLGDAATEADTVTVTVQVEPDELSQIKAGHRIQTKFQHIPDWDDWRWSRIKRLTLLQDESTAESIRLRLELSPQSEAVPADVLSGGITLTGIGTTGWWETSGSEHVLAFTTSTPVGSAADYTVVNSWDWPAGRGTGLFGYSGIQCDKDGTVDITLVASSNSVAASPSQTVTLNLLKNGTTIGTTSRTVVTGGLSGNSGVLTVTASGVSVSAGDVIEGEFVLTGNGSGLTVPTGTGQNSEQLTVVAS